MEAAARRRRARELTPLDAADTPFGEEHGGGGFAEQEEPGEADATRTQGDGGTGWVY